VDSLPPPSRESRPITFLTAAFWTLLVAVLLQVAMGVIDDAHPGASVDIVTIAACRLFAYSLVLFAILRVHEPESSIRRLLALRRPPLVMIPLAALVGAGLAPGAMWLNDVFAKRFPEPQADVDSYERIFAMPTMGKKIALVVALVVVMPVCDELFFRGALFTPLKRGRRAETVILATAAYETLLFGATAREIASFMAIALVLSWIRAASGSVIPSMTARIAFFAAEVVPLLLVGDASFSRNVVLGGLAIATASLAGIAAVGKRSERALEARHEDG
jgi:membrane protease YdiL (CAAX protease family)